MAFKHGYNAAIWQRNRAALWLLAVLQAASALCSSTASSQQQQQTSTQLTSNISQSAITPAATLKQPHQQAIQHHRRVWDPTQDGVSEGQSTAAAAAAAAVVAWGFDPTARGNSDHMFAAAGAYHQVLQSHQHTLTAGRRRRGLVSVGAALRLRRVIADLQAGEHISVGVIGGSISWGFYMQRGVNDWFSLFNAWLRKAFPSATVVQKNGCVPATTAEYVSMCLDKFVDPKVDLIFLEYAINDGYTDTSIDTQHARAFERLVRKVLQLPNRPAVVLMQALAQAIYGAQAPFYWTVQDHYGVLAQYYQLPWLSMRNAVFHEVLVGAPGFSTRDIYPEAEQDMQRHPNELGHKHMADVAVTLVQAVFEDMMLAPISLQDEWSQRLLQVPAPMFASNYESRNLACLIGEDFPSVVSASKDWTWRNDGTQQKPKWGFSTTVAGATLDITVDTRADFNESAVDNSAQGGATKITEGSSSSISSKQSQNSKISSSSGVVNQELGTQQLAAAAPAAAGSGSVSTEGSTRQLQAAVAGGSSRSSATLLSEYRQPLHSIAEREQAEKRSLLDVAELQWQQQPIGQVEGHTEVRDGAWWEAQQAQEAEQIRTTAEAAYVGYQEGDMLVWVGYTKTWRAAGKAVLTCHGGCHCKNVTIDAYHKWNSTQSFMAKVYTQQAAACTVRVTVLPRSSSGGNYFKVSGVMVTRRIQDYDGGDHTDVLLLNAMEGEEYKQGNG